MPENLPAVIVEINKQIEDFRSKGYHTIGGVTKLQSIPFGHKPVLTTLMISPDPKAREVYSMGREGEFQLSGIAFKKIGEAIGVQWIPSECKRIDDGRNPKRWCYRMVGMVKSMDGTWKKIIGDKEIDLDVLEQEIRGNYQKKVDVNEYYLKNPDKAKEKKYFVPKDFIYAHKNNVIGDWIDDCTRKDVLQVQKHALARAQTGAMSRAIKSLGVKESYSKDELGKPFVFPKLIFEPDPNNPIDRQFLLQQAAGVLPVLYPQAQMPTPQPEQAPQFNADFEVTEGEIIQAEVEESRNTSSANNEAYSNHEDEETPTQEESNRLDFMNSDKDQKMIILSQLIHRKSWKGKLSKPFGVWTDKMMVDFYDVLMREPDANQSQEKQEKLPWES